MAGRVNRNSSPDGGTGQSGGDSGSEGRTKEVKEDWDAEADQPPFYLPRERTVSYTSWSVRYPACGGRLSRCPCT